MPSTVRLHRVLAAKPEKVYRAFVEADAIAKWLPPNGFACTVASPRRESRRHPQDVISQFHHRQEPLLRICQAAVTILRRSEWFRHRSHTRCL
jgi:hypothetical protein